MRERLAGFHPEISLTQQPLDSAIVSFCSAYSKPNTREAYERDLRDFSSFATGDDATRLDQLTPKLIDNYLKHCEAVGLSHATTKRRIAALSSFLRRTGMEEFAKEVRDIMDKHIGSMEETGLLHPLSVEEAKNLQEASQGNSRDAAFIAIALATGANVAEILALRVNDMPEVDGQTSIRFGGRHERMIKLDPEASKIVKKHKMDSPEDASLFIGGRFGRKGKESLTRQGLWKILREYGKSIGRPDLNPRVLRETFIANVQTNDPTELGKLLGINVVYAYRMLERRLVRQQLPRSEVLFEITTK